MRKGDYMQTHSGLPFWAEDVKKTDIILEDIVACLPKICRYAGNTKKFYSVAEHSIRMSLAFPEFSKIALLHDAVEAYIGDIPSPVKNLSSEINLIEDNILFEIYSKYDVIPYATYGKDEIIPIHGLVTAFITVKDIIKKMDLSMLAYEKNHPEIMGGSRLEWECIKGVEIPTFQFGRWVLSDSCLTMEDAGIIFQDMINVEFNRDINIW
jgi:hypothetical protein